MEQLIKEGLIEESQWSDNLFKYRSYDVILFPQITFYLIENQNSRHKNNLIAIYKESRLQQDWIKQILLVRMHYTQTILRRISISRTLATRSKNSFSQEREFLSQGNEVEGSTRKNVWLQIILKESQFQKGRIFFVRIRIDLFSYVVSWSRGLKWIKQEFKMAAQVCSADDIWRVRSLLFLKVNFAGLWVRLTI